MADKFNVDFARLVPRNQVAQHLFSATRIYVDENKSFHLRFLQSNNASVKYLQRQMNPSSPSLIMKVRSKAAPRTFK